MRSPIEHPLINAQKTTIWLSDAPYPVLCAQFCLEFFFSLFPALSLLAVITECENSWTDIHPKRAFWLRQSFHHLNVAAVYSRCPAVKAHLENFGLEGANGPILLNQGLLVSFDLAVISFDLLEYAIGEKITVPVELRLPKHEIVAHIVRLQAYDIDPVMTRRIVFVFPFRLGPDDRKLKVDDKRITVDCAIDPRSFRSALRTMRP